jgi:hypothetical protein
MSFGFSGTSTEVKIDGEVLINIPVLSVARITRNSNGSSTIYTVPAGKKAKIYYCSSLNVAGLVGGASVITLNSNEFANCTVLTGAYGHTVFNSFNPVLLTAGQTAVLTTSNVTAGTFSGIIGYVEEDV